MNVILEKKINEEYWQNSNKRLIKERDMTSNALAKKLQSSLLYLCFTSLFPMEDSQNAVKALATALLCASISIDCRFLCY